MRFGLVAAAIVAAWVSVPANAATIVQYDSEQGALSGFSGFNSLLGHLNSVTLDITLSKSRVWEIDAPVPVGTTKSVAWAVNGVWGLSSYYLGEGNGVSVPLVGAGTSVVSLNSVFQDRAYGYFMVTASGGTTLNLDPARFIDQHSIFDGSDSGFYDTAGSDTTFTVAGANRLLHLTGACYVSPVGPVSSGEDFCGSASYRLTFDYTPGAVPEPSTWALMFVGFGALGSAMRRKGQVRAKVIFA